MNNGDDTPPAVLAGARVLEYGIVDARIIYSGHSYLFVDGKEVGPVARIALCRSSDSSQVLLVHCDDHWSIVGVAEYQSIAEAKLRAEKIYQGISNCWIDAHSSGSDASSNVTDEVAQHCVFCGRGPLQVNSLIEKNGKVICDLCTGEIWNALQRNR